MIRIPINIQVNPISSTCGAHPNKSPSSECSKPVPCRSQKKKTLLLGEERQSQFVDSMVSNGEVTIVW